MTPRSSGRRTALITGAASGIGAALVRQLAAEGAWVIAVDLKAERAREQPGENVRCMDLDVSVAPRVEELLTVIESQYPSLDLVVNCAGICGYQEAGEITATAWSREIDVNLKGTIAVSLGAYRLMRRKGGGAIVNLGSLSSFLLPPLFLPYVSTKAAVLAFSRALALEAEAYGVYVGVACPGNVQTPLLSSWKQSRFTPPVTADAAARRILRGVERRERIMVFPLYAKIFWYLDRLGPGLLDPLRRKILARARERALGDGG